MPAPIDPNTMVGLRFGALVVIAPEGGLSVWGGNNMPSYRCRCDCGNEQVIHHLRLRGASPRSLIRACDPCRFRRECAYCGKSFQSQRYRATCSKVCHTELRRARHRAHYHKRVAADPDLNRRAWARKKQILAAHPGLAQLHRMEELARGRRRRALMTEADREAERQVARARYARDRDQVLTRRRQRLAELSPEEQARRAEAQRAKARQKWLEDRERVNAMRRRIRAENPEAYNAYQRWRWRQRQQQRARAELARLQQHLIDRIQE